MRIFVYAFGPYRRFADNVTERVLRHVGQRRWLNKVVFPVRFQRRQFIDAVNRFRPDLIIGLGQCSRGRLLRMETKAINQRRDSRKEELRSISRGGAPQLFTHLRLLDNRIRLSRRAGDYVCNYSMYVILEYLQRHQLPVQFGFIHVPRDFDALRAAAFLDRALVKIVNSRAMGMAGVGSKKC
jgi:pyroglutamyl-peptidase